MTKLRLGILGTARVVSRRIVPAVAQTSNVTLVAIASRAEARAREFAETNGIPKAYGNYEALLADPDVEAVYNPLPNSLHAEWTIRAARAGKHVLCEKPFAANCAEAEAMLAVCDAQRVLLMEAFMYRFHPQTEKVLELARVGAIGAVKLVRAVFCFTLDRVGNFRFDPAYAGGSLMDVGCYCVHAIRAIVGAEPTHVSAFAQWVNGVDETMTGLLHFADDTLGAFECSFNAAYRSHYEIIGERGRIEVVIPFITNNRATRIWLHHANEQSEPFDFPPVDPYALMLEHFADSVLRQKPLRYPPSDSLAQQRVLEALLTAAHTHRVTPITHSV
jgi:predicted dehydrogenase